MVRVYADVEALADAACDEFVARAGASLRERGRFDVVLSGGSTPRRLYERLARVPLDWDSIGLWFGDERHVPPRHEDSNYRMLQESLLTHAGVDASRVHRIRGELPAEQAAREYEDELRRVFGLREGDVPRFDLALMGMGADGHTASLFPGTGALAVRDRLAAAVWVPHLAAWRVTLTRPVFEAARALVFLVAGADKRAPLARVLAAEPGASDLPAGAVAPPDGEQVWLVDRAASP